MANITISEEQLKELVHTAVAALGQAQVTARKARTSKPAQAVRPQADRTQVAPQNVDNPASRAQRKLVLVLSGTYPADSTGFKGFTKGDASRAIDALQAGKAVKIGRKTLKPKA